MTEMDAASNGKIFWWMLLILFEVTVVSTCDTIKINQWKINDLLFFTLPFFATLFEKRKLYILKKYVFLWYCGI